MDQLIGVPAVVDTFRPPIVAVDAKSPFGKCFFCGREIFTAFVVFPVVEIGRAQYTYQARAHVQCYPELGEVS